MSSDDRNKLGANVKIILAGMFSLVGIVILIIILQIYTRYLLQRRERRRRAVLYPFSRVAPISSEPQPPKSGLDQSVIESLPIFNYIADDRFDHGDAIECSVCLNTIVEEALVRLLPNCKHLFHADCIGMWLSLHMTCPNCRTTAEPGLEPPENGGLVVTGFQHATAPPVLEESATDGAAELEKAGGSGSLRRMLSRERSSRRIQSCGEEVCSEDLERQYLP